MKVHFMIAVKWDKMVISKTRETKSKANKKYSRVSLSPNIWLLGRDIERFFQNQRVKNDKKK